jgi:SAM-dependent methyltransferase
LAPENENPKKIEIDASDMKTIGAFLLRHPHFLFFSKEIRTFVAKRRAEKFGRDAQWSGANDQLVSFAVDYNKGHMDQFLESHVVRLIRPLSILDPIYTAAPSAKVLSIGPRNENELFHLCAYDFDLENIEAIDLVSNSPLVTIMDMHDLQYDDGAFDVVISGWTLPYSRDPKTALSEAMRVLKPGGLLCLGLTRVPPDDPSAIDLEKEGATNYLSTEQLLADIGPGVARVEFSHDPIDLSQKGAILLIVRRA